MSKMGKIGVGMVSIILVHAFGGWALCDATMVIGMAVTSLYYLSTPRRASLC